MIQSLGTRMVVAACVTGAVLSGGVIALLIGVSGVNKPAGNRHLALVIPFVAPIVTVWLLRFVLGEQGPLPSGPWLWELPPSETHDAVVSYWF